jgi:hypothetical protein
MGSIGTKVSGMLHGVTMGATALEGAIGAVGIAAGFALAGAAVVGLAHAAMEAAHLQEAVAKVEQAFGTATPRVLAMADELAKKFGVVNKEILDVAASFGLMLQGSGVAREMSADMSVALSKIAVDAASFFDVSMTEAITRLQSGLSGEMEAVRRWGINLSESNIKRQGQVAGFGSGDLSQEAKTLIRFKLIMEGLAAAAGDAERSQFRLVGQWKLFTGELYTFATNLGAVVVPIFTGILYVVNNVLAGVNAAMSMIGAAFKSTLAYIAGLFGYTDIFGEADVQKQREAIDARIAATEADRAKDAEAAKASELAEKHKPKGWQGGLEEWAKHLQEGAFGKGKDTTAADQLKTQQAMAQLLSEIKNKLGQPMPAAVGP